MRTHSRYPVQGQNTSLESVGLSPRRSRARRSRSGLGLLDMMVASIVLTVAITGASGAILVSMSQNRLNRENAIALQAARQVLERLASRPFREIFAANNASTADDGGLTSPATGPNFAVAGLEPRVGDADGMCGRILFPTQTIAGVEQLREDVVDAAMGMPRDLDGASGIDTNDHRADYRLLPVRVRVEWRGAGGARTFDLETMLCQR